MNIIKEIREATKLSQKEFSEKFGIPKRTLQKWEQQQADPLPYLANMIKEQISFEQYMDVDKYLFKPSNTFKKVIKGDFKNVNHVHPLQQQRVEDIINAIKEYTEVKSITVFGSSVTYKCNYESDIDIYVELDKNINVKNYNVDCPVDYWTNYTVEPEMLNEIKAKGVRVYDR